MANHVHVILKRDVDKLGHAGELVRVRPGFARNYLLPRALAVVATDDNVRHVEHERKIAVAGQAKQKSAAEGLSAKISGLRIEIEAQAGEGDKLFGSVTTRDIAEALHKQGVELDRKHLELATAIKTLGEYDVTAKLGLGVHAQFKVVVKASS
jgi:large subunit ribosomal protein L9